MQAAAGVLGLPSSAPLPRSEQAKLWVPHGGAVSREAAQSPFWVTAPPCGAPAFFRRCSGQLASFPMEPGRTGAARRKSVCDPSLQHVIPAEQPSSTGRLCGCGLRVCSRGRTNSHWKNWAQDQTARLFVLIWHSGKHRDSSKLHFA